MMGPEAMGVANANLVWSDEKVCRNFLCGTCPHALFTNTVCSSFVQSYLYLPHFLCRKWTLVHARSPILNASRLSISQPRRLTPMTPFSTGFRWNTKRIYSHSLMNVTGESGQHTVDWRKHQKRTRRQQT